MNRLKQSKVSAGVCKICFKDLSVDSFHSLVTSTIICSSCLNKMDPKFKSFNVDGIKALSLYPYNDEIKRLIYCFKGCQDYELKDVFLSYFIKELKNKYKGYYLLPVPSSKKHDEERGFNQVIEIFKPLNLEMLLILEKVNDETQKEKTLKERINSKGMFKIKNKETISGKKILIVDDICTTGSSLRAVIALIKDLSPKDIKILVVAKRDFTKEELEKIKDKDLILK